MGRLLVLNKHLLTQLLCLGNIQKKSFFSVSYVVEYFMHKGNNRIPKREQLACLAFVVLPCYLLHTEKFVWWEFLNTHTVYMGRCTGGSWQCREEETLVCSHSFHQPLGHSPLCSNNHCQWQSDYWSYNCIKLMLIIWIFYFIFGCSGNVSP